MFVAVTRNASPRIAGFLASTLLRVSATCYVGPRITSRARQKIIDVVAEFASYDREASVTFVWTDEGAVSGVAVAHVSEPCTNIIDIDGIMVVMEDIGHK